MNSFGRNFRITLFGESHGECVGVVIDGIPPGIAISEEIFFDSLYRRNPHIEGTTQRKEMDIPHIVSGIYNGRTTGCSLTILFNNEDVKSEHYPQMLTRPSHTDFVAREKYNGFNDARGGGIFSGRMTLGLVAAGVVARQIIDKKIQINANLNPPISSSLLAKIKSEGDSLGGIVECSISGVPVGLGEPFFNSFESLLSHLVFSVPGIKGIEFGAGFKIAEMTGSEANDCYIDADGKTLTNHSGGINGGITNGNDIVFRVAVKPTPSIAKPQYTYNFKTNEMEELKIVGRHDTCFALRMPVIIEATTAIILAELYITNNK